MLPSPVEVVRALVTDFPLILTHAGYTLQEAFYGLGIGIGLAFITATLMDHFLTLNRALYPIMIITQTIPTIAIAPVLVLWMGFGMAPKITLVVITTFFPIAVGLLDGYKSVDRDSVDLMRAMGAGRLQIFGHVKLPAAFCGGKNFRFLCGCRCGDFRMAGRIQWSWGIYDQSKKGLCF